MSHQKPKKGHIEEDESWLITYADMITLMMAFFIVLVAMSEPNAGKQQKVSEALASAGFTGEATQETSPVQVMQEEVEMMIEGSSLEAVMSVEVSDGGIQLELASGHFYQSGSAKFRREAIDTLLKVVQILKDFDFDAYEMQVEGHTDDVPIKSAQYPSNWELSAARSTNIVRFLIANGLKAELMQATGYAETRPKVPNLDAKGAPIPENRERNRRVVIRVERVD